MGLRYNLTQMTTINLQNANVPSQASVSMLEGEEFPDPEFGISYTNMTNGAFGKGTIIPWNYTEYQIDWTKYDIKFYIGGYLARTISREENSNLFSTPSPLYLRHWSNGNLYSSQGPPEHPSSANVAWVRMFFNSSTMTQSDHARFDEQCNVTKACFVDDTKLRASSVYPPSATKKWKQTREARPTRWSAITIATFCIFISTLVLLGPIWQRVQGKTKPRQSILIWLSTDTEDNDKPSRGSILSSIRSKKVRGGLRLTWPTASSARLTGDRRKKQSFSIPTASGRMGSLGDDGNFGKIEKAHIGRSRSVSIDSIVNKSGLRAAALSGDKALHGPLFKRGDSILPPRRRWSSMGEPATILSPTRRRQSTISIVEIPNDASNESEGDGLSRSRRYKWSNRHSARLDAQLGNKLREVDEVFPQSFDKREAVFEASPISLEEKRRVDHLAGVVTTSTLLITVIHFVLTYVPGTINPGVFTHYNSENIARKTVSSLLLNVVWIGPILMVSARFLVSEYLRSGDLLIVADKTVRRTFRLILPILVITLVEYFLIDVGAINWLQYLPSITWSTWPFVVEFSDFGKFLTETLELAYVIPNAVPRIMFNYCAGVLWTIPIQLQGSWQALFAIIVIREIKTPWKRFGFYGFCIINHWYALSWGSYLYLAIMLVDLEVTYKWRRYLFARPFIYYPLITFCILLALAGLTLDLISQWTGISYVALEYGIHPDITTGLTISQAGPVKYPEYYIPRLNGVVFAFGLHAAVELSPTIQQVFSLKVLTMIFPHVFTIYLVHGFVFWSLGSRLCVTFAVLGMSYWANVLIVAVCCYASIALALPLLTPLVETMGGTVAKNIWRHAREKPVPRRPTLYPFSKDFFLDRQQACA